MSAAAITPSHKLAPHFTFTVKLNPALEAVIHLEADNLDDAIKVLGTVGDLMVKPQIVEAK